jgi:hypothetical protein
MSNHIWLPRMHYYWVLLVDGTYSTIASHVWCNRDYKAVWQGFATEPETAIEAAKGV